MNINYQGCYRNAELACGLGQQVVIPLAFPLWNVFVKFCKMSFQENNIHSQTL
jgi:hypothetical protein